MPLRQPRLRRRRLAQPTAWRSPTTLGRHACTAPPRGRPPSRCCRRGRWSRSLRKVEAGGRRRCTRAPPLDWVASVHPFAEALAVVSFRQRSAAMCHTLAPPPSLPTPPLTHLCPQNHSAHLLIPARSGRVDNTTKETVQKLPLMSARVPPEARRSANCGRRWPGHPPKFPAVQVQAGPRDGDEWIKRMKELPRPAARACCTPLSLAAPALRRKSTWR